MNVRILAPRHVTANVYLLPLGWIRLTLINVELSKSYCRVLHLSAIHEASHNHSPDQTSYLPKWINDCGR
jgi:hypothetical protein